MSFELPCPKCTTPLSLDELHRGSRISCPACKAVFTVPRVSPPPAPPPQSRAALSCDEKILRELKGINSALVSIRAMMIFFTVLAVIGIVASIALSFANKPDAVLIYRR